LLKLAQNDYLKASDFAKLLSAPGASCTATSTGSGSSLTLTLNGTSGLKVYPLTSADASNVIFAVTSNYEYNTDLNDNGAPYGDKGFVIIRKAGMLLCCERIMEGNRRQETAFESLVVKSPVRRRERVSGGDPPNVLKQP